MTMTPEAWPCVLAHILVLGLCSTGVAMLALAALSLWGYSVKAWLESSWTRGKPLNCWTCMIGWCALGIEAVAGWSSSPGEAILASCGAIGLMGPIMRRWFPIAPASGPPLEGMDGEEGR